MKRVDVTATNLRAKATNAQPVLARTIENPFEEVLIWLSPLGGYFATEMTCPHKNHELTSQCRATEQLGRVAVLCSGHGWYFDSQSGELIAPERAFSAWKASDRKPMRSWKVVINGEVVLIDDMAA